VKPGTGTLCSLAPEQARGAHAGPPADSWGLSALLHEALTGAAPFGDGDGDGDGDGAFPCLDRAAPPVRALRPRAPRSLAAAIDAGLAPDPTARPRLHELLDVLDEHAGRPAGPGRRRR